MAKVDLGQVVSIPKGWYDNSASYTVGDIVYYQFGSFVCISPTQITGKPPAMTGVDSNWLLIGNLFGVYNGEYYTST